MINRIKWFMLVITAAFLLFWFVSIVRVEFLTFRHGDEFTLPDDIAWYVGALDSIKVLEYTERSARVYFYTRRGIGFDVHFVRSRNENEWLLETWRTAWSYTGTAGSYVWPYYHHSIEGRIILSILGIPYALLLSIICAISYEQHLKKQSQSDWLATIVVVKYILLSLIIIYILFWVLSWVIMFWLI